MVPKLAIPVFPDASFGSIFAPFRSGNAKKMFFSYFLSLISNDEQLY